jgi:hypothetical protein
MSSNSCLLQLWRARYTGEGELEVASPCPNSARDVTLDEAAKNARRQLPRLSQYR